MLQTAIFIKNNSFPQTSYQNLFSEKPERSGMVSLSSQRNPDISVWGGEWIGTYEAEGAYKENLVSVNKI